MDPIVDIAALGKKYKIPVHVDACLGGFVIAFMEEAGYPLPPFDFRVDGVTSISVDSHKVFWFVLLTSCNRVNVDLHLFNLVWVRSERIFDYFVFRSFVSAVSIFRSNWMVRRHLRLAYICRITIWRYFFFFNAALHNGINNNVYISLALVATCWAAMMYYGRNGYVETTKKMVETQRYIEKE